MFLELKRSFIIVLLQAKTVRTLTECAVEMAGSFVPSNSSDVDLTAVVGGHMVAIRAGTQMVHYTIPHNKLFTGTQGFALHLSVIHTSKR